ncbi:MAG: Sua5/YciO/YrdC/YwlC family protein [Aliiglaciecola sp.]|uniref:Sua5/YciO/YrdC/YwlC family protein n=1 Tax=Aliiglaciecola sp. TaxID=1872441 RepID=UPI0032991398
MDISQNPHHFKQQFLDGVVFAYPTEAVFGLGCDPTNEAAVMQLLALKNRPLEKGLILIASSKQQLVKFVNFSAVDSKILSEVEQSWPGPNTWLLPKQQGTPDFITGGSDLIAVRVSDHPVVNQMCDLLNSAIVSTSANLNGEPPAKTCDQVHGQFGSELLCLDGALGNQKNPSQIRNGLTGETVRAS